MSLGDLELFLGIIIVGVKQVEIYIGKVVNFCFGVKDVLLGVLKVVGRGVMFSIVCEEFDELLVWILFLCSEQCIEYDEIMEGVFKEFYCFFGEILCVCKEGYSLQIVCGLFQKGDIFIV